MNPANPEGETLGEGLQALKISGIRSPMDCLRRRRMRRRTVMYVHVTRSKSALGTQFWGPKLTPCLSPPQYLFTRAFDLLPQGMDTRRWAQS